VQGVRPSVRAGSPYRSGVLLRGTTGQAGGASVRLVREAQAPPLPIASLNVATSVPQPSERSMQADPRATDTRGMVARALRSFLDRIKAPEYRMPEETFWQSQRRRSFRRQERRRVGKQRP
jgi:hypothetical protein